MFEEKCLYTVYTINNCPKCKILLHTIEKTNNDIIKSIDITVITNDESMEFFKSEFNGKQSFPLLKDNKNNIVYEFDEAMTLIRQ